MAGTHEEELAGAEEADLLRSFSVPRVEPSELLRRSRADETAPPSRQRLLELWLRYWNAWETDSLPDGVWWDQDAIQGLLSDHVILIKPEGAFQGKEVVLDEYECFAKRFPASRKMERRLTDVFVDERRQTTTAAYEVIIPEGILPEDEDEEDGEGGGGGGKDREGGRLRRRQSATSRIFSVAEVLRWSLKDDESGKGPLLEVHYFGSGVRLTTSRIKGKLHRARQHRKRSGRGDEDVAELELGAFDFNLELGEDVVLDTSTVSDDRPLAQLTFNYMSALLRSDKDQVLSLVAEDYKHLTAFGDSLAHFGPAAGGGKVKGEIDSCHCDETQRAVSIERRYELGEKMTEIVDLIYWEEPGPRIRRHATYGFSWQSAVRVEEAGEEGERGMGRGGRRTVDDLLSGEQATRVRLRGDGGQGAGEEGEDLFSSGTLSRSKKNKSENDVSRVGFV